MLGFTVQFLYLNTEELRVELIAFNIKSTILSCLHMYRPLEAWLPFKTWDKVSKIAALSSRATFLYTAWETVVSSRETGKLPFKF